MVRRGQSFFFQPLPLTCKAKRKATTPSFTVLARAALVLTTAAPDWVCGRQRAGESCKVRGKAFSFVSINDRAGEGWSMPGEGRSGWGCKQATGRVSQPGEGRPAASGISRLKTILVFMGAMGPPLALVSGLDGGQDVRRDGRRQRPMLTDCQIPNATASELASPHTNQVKSSQAQISQKTTLIKSS